MAKTDPLQGTLDLLILKVLALGPNLQAVHFLHPHSLVRPSRSWCVYLSFGFLVGVLVGTAALLPTGRVRAEQDACPDVPAGGNVATLDEYAESESTCTLPGGAPADKNLIPEGAFLKAFKYALLDAHAQSSGTCQVRLLDGQGGCIDGQLQLRYVAKIVTQTETPTGLTSTHNNFPIKPDGTLDQRYDVDSRQAGTTNLGTWRVLFGFEGKNEIRWQSVINKTACNIEPGNSPLKELFVNVVKCQPNWWIIGGPTRTVHLPTTTISVYVPSGMSGLNTPTDQAIADWNAALAGTGPQMQRVSAPCGTGGDCVNVVEDTVASGCAKADTGVPNSSGEAQTPGTITFPPGWNTRPADRNRRSMAHELGHLLGLNHTTCSANDSIMAPVTSCTSTSGMTLSPKASDTLPTTSSTYGNHNQKTCGF